MSDAATFGRYLFWLALFLVVVAYFSGFVADTKAFSGALNSLILTATGRNSSGQFANYPGNATKEIAAMTTHQVPLTTNAPL